MGLVIGVIMGFLGIAMLIIPFIIDLYVSRNQTDKTKATDYKRSLEASAGMIAIAVIFMIGGLILVGFVSTWGLAKSEYSGLTTGWEGKSSQGGSKQGGEKEGTKQGGMDPLLTYMLLKGRGGATEGASGEGLLAEGESLAAEGAEFAV